MLTALLYAIAIIASILFVIFLVLIFVTHKVRKANIIKLQRMVLGQIKEADDLKNSLGYNFTNAQCQMLMRTFQRATDEEWDNLSFKRTGDEQVDKLLATLEPKFNREDDKLAHATFCWLMENFPSFAYMSDKRTDEELDRLKR